MAWYIDKQLVADMLHACADMATGTNANTVWLCAERMVELLPCADVAPVVHGRWIWFHEIVKDMHGLRAIDGCKCSLCGLGNSGDNFCECCGAKMDEEKNDG